MSEAAPEEVFLNCPFDEGYRNILQALIFAIHACGFRPRCGLEEGDGLELRLPKLLKMIRECRFGVHDLSRAGADAITNLGRFNMPFELGLFMGCKIYGGKAQKPKQAIVFDSQQFRFRAFISDLGGVDIVNHEDSPEQAIEALRNWLRQVSKRKLLGPEQLLELYTRFRGQLPDLAREAGFGSRPIPYADYEEMVVDWLLQPPHSPSSAS